MSLKRKHVVFDDDAQSAPVAGPSSSGHIRFAAPPVATIPAAPAQPALSKPKEKTVAKKRYLVKKSKRQKVLRAARKAAAPKNKQWMPDGEEGAGLAGNAAGLHAEESESSSDDEVEEEEAVIALSTAVLPAPHSSTVAKDPEDERAMRKQEKREKRAQRTERRAARAAKRAAMTAAGASPAPIHDINEDDLKDDPEGLDNIDEGDPVDPSSPAFDFLPLLEPSAHISRSPSPPYLEPFPLPMPVAAPNPEILSRQGLPAGLEDAEFVDQELKVSVDQIGAKSAKGVSERMRKRLKEIGVEDFFAVQAVMLPRLLSEQLVPPPYVPLNDYLVSAPTGSGKTLAYAIPLIEVIAQRIVPRLRALIVLPTRDLVVQVRETMEALAKGTGLAHSFAHEQAALVADMSTRLIGGSSKVDVLIATPGRLIDHLASTPNFTLQHLRFLVIDEADRLLNQSFHDWLAKVLSHINPPVNPTLPEKWLPWDHLAGPWMAAYGLLDTESEVYEPAPVVLLFSATLTRDPAKVAALALRNPRYYIVQSASHSTSATSIGQQFALPAALSEKVLILPPALKPLNLIHLVHSPTFAVRSALVFTKSVESAARLVKLLEFFEDAWVGEKLVVKGYTREMKPRERKRLLQEFAEGKVNLLVCSDLIARGIDLPSVQHVVSYDIPLDMRKYVHRVGRTARAGREGTAWTLVEKQEALHFKAMLKAGGHEKRIQKVKVKEEEVDPYKQSYGIAITRLKEHFGREI